MHTIVPSCMYILKEWNVEMDDTGLETLTVALYSWSAFRVKLIKTIFCPSSSE